MKEVVFIGADSYQNNEIIKLIKSNRYKIHLSFGVVDVIDKMNKGCKCICVLSYFNHNIAKMIKRHENAIIIPNRYAISATANLIRRMQNDD